MPPITGGITATGSLGASIRRTPVKEGKAIQSFGTLRLLEMADVDETLLDDGAVLIYDASTSKFKVVPTIENANTKIVGGKY